MKTSAYSHASSAQTSHVTGFPPDVTGRSDALSSIGPPSKPANRRGAVTLEFALVLPIMLLMILGIIEFGRAMMVANVLTSAAREGARVGAVPNGDNADILAVVTEHLTVHAVSPNDLSIVVRVNGTEGDASTASTGDILSVHVSAPFSAVSWLPEPFFLGAASMTGQAVMRRE